jgi:hypothetical protein
MRQANILAASSIGINMAWPPPALFFYDGLNAWHQAKPTLFPPGGSQTRSGKGGSGCAGNTKLLAGCNIELQGFGVLDGVMHIEKATHTLNSSGYGVSIELMRGWK